MQRILCVNPEHVERTPSMVVYDDGWAHCFGCGYRVPVSSLGRSDLVPGPSAPPADLAGELARIRALPKASVRGLELPADEDSFYIVWPSGDYYKRRKFFPSDGRKYLCPRGHKKPLFVAHHPKGANTLALVEGELNALSLSSINPPFAVASPGGAGDFNDRALTFCLQFCKHCVIVDKDRAGLEAAMRMKGLLLQAGKSDVRVKLMARDCNELLQSGELKKEQWA